MATPVPSLGYDPMDWDYIALEAQYRITLQLIEKYTTAQHEENVLGPHNPKGNLEELNVRKAELSKRRLMARLLFAAAGRTPPDYDVYKKSYQEMKHDHSNAADPKP